MRQFVHVYSQVHMQPMRATTLNYEVVAVDSHALASQSDISRPTLKRKRSDDQPMVRQ